MVKTKKGISMIALLITISVFLILLTVITISSDKIVNNTKKKQFAREIYEVQNLVDKYKYEKEEYPYTILDDNTKESISIDITDDINDQFKNEGVTEGDKAKLYTIDLNKIGAENITRGIKKDNNLKDVYAFSEKTGIVYYIKGYKVGKNVYYTLTDELKGQIGYGKDTSNISNSKVISETASMDYVQDGLVLLLDGIRNTRSGHSTSTNVWEDLSGNNYDYTLNDIKINDNNIYFKGTANSYALRKENLSEIFGNTLYDDRTIEIVVKDTSDSHIWICGNSSSRKAIGIYVGTLNVSISPDNVSTFTLKSSALKVNNYSILHKKEGEICVYQNDEQLVKTNNLNCWNHSGEVSYIGNSSTNGTPLNGEIYSIRVYNRILTEKEINHNYQIDKKKFGI